MDQATKEDLLDQMVAADPLAETDEVGELAMDVYENANEVVIKAPMAGVDPKDLELSITDDTLTIRGKRHAHHEREGGKYLLKECYWGAFERVYTLPVPVDSEKAKASLKDGLLTITIPKSSKSKTKVIEVKAE